MPVSAVISWSQVFSVTSPLLSLVESAQPLTNDCREPPTHTSAITNPVQFPFLPYFAQQILITSTPPNLSSLRLPCSLGGLLLADWLRSCHLAESWSECEVHVMFFPFLNSHKPVFQYLKTVFSVQFPSCSWWQGKSSTGYSVLTERGRHSASSSLYPPTFSYIHNFPKFLCK